MAYRVKKYMCLVTGMRKVLKMLAMFVLLPLLNLALNIFTKKKNQKGI